jgi:thiamine biosynthesis lipoprotein
VRALLEADFATAEPDDPHRIVGFSGRALGSSLRLQVRLPASAPDAPAAAAWDAVVTEFAAVDAALSRFRDDSELTALNRLAGTDRVVTVSWRLRAALAAIHRAGRITDGRFDASVFDVLEQMGEHGAALAGPADCALPATGAAVVRLGPIGEPRVSRVTVPERPVDLGGIGKGLALRWAAAAATPLLPLGAGMLIEAGGDLVAAGQGPVEGWMIGIDDPVAIQPDAGPVAVLALQRGAVSTSSIGTRRWTAPDGRAVHHLVDPSTREPARTGLIAVTVAASDPAWAEVWTKALFLAGTERIGDEARSRGLAAWWLDSEGRLSMTPAARVESPWVAEDRVR